MDAFKRTWTIWKFTSPTTGETVIIAKPAECRESDYQHEYQRILQTVEAYTPKEALRGAAV